MPDSVERIYTQLDIREPHYEASFSNATDPSARYQFELCRKQATLGDVVVDQFWMPINLLYGQRNRRAVNQRPIVDFWWAICGDNGTQSDESIQATYLLANILPHARGNGSRRVFLDSFQIVPERRRRQMQEWIETLDQRLSDSRLEQYDEIAFRDATADLIGPPVVESDVQLKYTEMASRLLSEGREAFLQGGTAAADAVLGDWKKLMNSIGRRSGNSIEKRVLDILSYECRAALHRCYSAVWNILLPALGGKYDLTDESFMFHRFWHLDHCSESDHGDEAYFHLFHGHVFGLHPACGPLLLTQCGGDLFGEWLQEGTLESYQRVLHALAVAVGYYGEKYEIAALLRKKDGTMETYGDMVALEEQEAERRSGRRRRKKLAD